MLSQGKIGLPAFLVMKVLLIRMLSIVARPTPAGALPSGLGVSVPSSKMISIETTCVTPKKKPTGAVVWSKVTRNQFAGSCGEADLVPPLQPKKKVWPVSSVTLKRGAPAPQCPPSR